MIFGEFVECQVILRPQNTHLGSKISYIRYIYKEIIIIFFTKGNKILFSLVLFYFFNNNKINTFTPIDNKYNYLLIVPNDLNYNFIIILNYTFYKR